LGGELISEALIERNVKYPYNLDSRAFTTIVPRKLLMLEARGQVLEEVPLKELITYDLEVEKLTR